MGDGDYMYAFQELIMLVAYEFEPDLVIGKFSTRFETLSPLLTVSNSICGV
jgi:hypothetical protein